MRRTDRSTATVVNTPNYPESPSLQTLNNEYKEFNIAERDVTLIAKPEQSGKTFLMLAELVKSFSEDRARENINFIICDNNLLQLLQTAKRVNSDTNMNQYKNKYTNETYLEFSSSKRTLAKSSNDVCMKILREKANNILCCSNGKRFSDIVYVIKSIQQTSQNFGANDFHYNIWCDEADRHILSIDSNFMSLFDNNIHLSIYLLTATPGAIIKKYKKIKVMALENSTIPDYHGWNNNRKIIVDRPPNPKYNNLLNESFIEHILNKYNRYVCKGSKWFIPASVAKKSHNMVKDICLKYKIATMIINGDGIAVHKPDGSSYNFEKDEVPHKLIPRIYEELGLYNHPFAITGHYCIARGITISSPEFMLTHGIMPFKCSSKSESSQIAGRLKGNQKHWENYNPPIVFTTKQFDKIASEVEEKTKRLSEIAFEENWETVTLDQFKCIEKSWHYYEYPEPFATYENALLYLVTQLDQINEHTLNIQKMSKRTPFWPIEKDPRGYILTTKMNKKKDIDNNIHKKTQMPMHNQRIVLNRVDIFHDVKLLRDISLGTNISPPEGRGASYIIIPVYENEQSLYNEVKYVVRHTKNKA